MRLRLLVLAALLLMMSGSSLSAQVRERPVPFDSAGRVSVITAPLAARLGLSAPAWPVTGDYLDARLYALDDASSSFVLVVRRQRELLERYSIDAATRRQLAAVVARGSLLAAGTTTPDAAPTYISEPVRGSFVLNQTLLGGVLFAPAASYLVSNDGDNGAAAFATYLAVTGGTFFTAASLTQSTTVSRAQNHLSWHSARRGAIAANLTLFALAGEGPSDKAVALSLLAGGIVGDVIGFQVGKPMTDAEAHGTSHGSTVTAALMGGIAGTAGLLDDVVGAEGRNRLAAALVVGAGAVGYPLGLRYVRGAPYRVTAGDVGTLVPAELLALAALATVIPEDAWGDNPKVVSGILTAGFLGGAILGDRFLVRPFDHTEAEARLLMYGTAAGALVGIAVPVLADARNSNVYFGAVTVGGLIGAALTTNFMKPASANLGVGSLPRGEDGVARSRFDVRFVPEGALMASMKQRGTHPVMSITF